MKDLENSLSRDLEIFTENIVKLGSVEDIYMFGSYVYGIPNDESDIDIYTVVRDGIEDISELYADFRLLWRKRSVPIDLLVGYSEVFNRRKSGPTIERTIDQKGVKLYGQ